MAIYDPRNARTFIGKSFNFKQDEGLFHNNIPMAYTALYSPTFTNLSAPGPTTLPVYVSFLSESSLAISVGWNSLASFVIPDLTQRVTATVPTITTTNTFISNTIAMVPFTNANLGAIYVRCEPGPAGLYIGFKGTKSGAGGVADWVEQDWDGGNLPLQFSFSTVVNTGEKIKLI